MTNSGKAIHEIAVEARANSERWFPIVHGEGLAMVPLAVHYALGMSGEVGEVANLVKKWLRLGKGKASCSVLGEMLAHELADVFIYLLLLADELGVDLEAAYEEKRNINEKRWGQ